MIIWTIKLLSTARRAIAGRKYPHQLAWAVAFGLLLGIVPHGNLLALGLLLVVLSLKLNHAMAGLTAIGASFGATLLDPYSHRLGDAVLTDPRFADVAASAWQLPLVPWTDLNNTVVVGSFLIGVAALVPVFAVTYPLFRWLAPAVDPEPSEDNQEVAQGSRSEPESHQIVLVEQAHQRVSKPHRAPRPVTQSAVVKDDQQIEILPSWEITDDQPKPEESAPAEEKNQEDGSAESKDVAVETRIDVIRMKDYREAPTSATSTDGAESEQTTEPEQPMDEALSYLLRQLRDSQQRKVA